MELSLSSNLFDTVDGVFPAQKRNSANSQATLIRVGIETLQKKRLDEIAIPDLAKSCGVLVGAFYARFRDKDAYIRALQAQTIVGILQNDLVNSFHAFKACDQALSAELSRMLEGYLGLR